MQARSVAAGEEAEAAASTHLSKGQATALNAGAGSVAAGAEV